MTYSIHPEHAKAYRALEVIRETGDINMWGAAPYLRKMIPELCEEESKEILLEWISNYDTLLKQGYLPETKLKNNNKDPRLNASDLFFFK